MVQRIARLREGGDRVRISTEKRWDYTLVANSVPELDVINPQCFFNCAVYT